MRPEICNRRWYPHLEKHAGGNITSSSMSPEAKDRSAFSVLQQLANLAYNPIKYVVGENEIIRYGTNGQGGREHLVAYEPFLRDP